ncbi:MAG: hypothetical protein HOO99_07710 [Hyphomicrobiaceae bacterium]|nr:hypothetical protein [Hyphomicrobiaceae bacterium]
MLRDGVYVLTYTGDAYAARGVFVARKAAFFGVGQTGAIYEGSFWLDRKTDRMLVDGCVRFRPGTPLIFGGVAGDDGLIIPFKGQSTAGDPYLSYVYTIYDKPVECALEYMGPIPG